MGRKIGRVQPTWILIFSLVLGSCSTQHEKLFCSGEGNLRIKRGSDADELLREKGQFKSSVIPGGFCYSWLELRSGQSALSWTICDPSGEVMRRMSCSDEPINLASTVNSLDFAGGNVFIQCEVNPSLAAVVVLNTKTTAYRTYSGSDFAWSPDGIYLALVQDPPHFGEQQGATPTLWVNNLAICTIPPNAQRTLQWQTGSRLILHLRIAGKPETIKEFDVRGLHPGAIN